MTDLLAIFGVGFVTVFLAGIQSRAVNHGDYGIAAGNSFLIGVSNAGLWTTITSPTTGVAGWLVYGLSGSIAITAAMYIHHKLFTRKKSVERNTS